MNDKMRMRLMPIASLALLAPAAAQIQSTTDSSLHTQREPYAIEIFGAFRLLVPNGDFNPKVAVAATMTKHPTIGVGAVADARGEITIHDGKLIVSYGKLGPHPAAEMEAAALMVTATVAAWQTVKVEQDVAADDIENFLARTATAHGLDGEGPFPFQIRGTLVSYTMHVNAERTNDPHGADQPVARVMEIKGNSIPGMVAGFYASRDLIGIVSQGATRTHSHWVSLDGKSTAHLDSWGLKAGAELSLPKP
jgi:alpha-acetolactate decarboxylase